MNIIGLDDEVPALRILTSFAEEHPHIESVKVFTSPQEALQHLRNYPTDLLFLDINMPTISGLDFYEKVKDSVRVVFTTAYKEYAHNAFDLNAVDYLLKPYNYDRFCQAIFKVTELTKTTITEKDFIHFRADHALKRIYFSEISYIQAYDDYIKIYTTNDKVTVVRQTLKTTLERLPSEQFCQVHRSFIVRLQSIKQVRSKVIYLEDLEIPIGRAYETEFMQRYLINHD
jgi:DNA-binding LytR/AlgR family response regulator